MQERIASYRIIQSFILSEYISVQMEQFAHYPIPPGGGIRPVFYISKTKVKRRNTPRGEEKSVEKEFRLTIRMHPGRLPPVERVIRPHSLPQSMSTKRKKEREPVSPPPPPLMDG